MILLPIESKKVSLSMRRSHGNAKMKVWKWVKKKGFTRMLKKTQGSEEIF